VTAQELWAFLGVEVVIHGRNKQKGNKSPQGTGSPYTDVTGISGQYFDSQKQSRSSALTHDSSVQDQLWKLAAHLTGAG